ncbi:MAG: S9 family peptidase [Acidobacteria bacterium]|nr:S9 family peptidase [Acidobacteriota bacterium]
MTIAGYGTWKSPLTAARVTAGALRFDHLVFDGDDLYWSEGRASEGGRLVVVRRSPDGAIGDVTPAGFNVRTRVHEYGGASYTVDRGTVYFSNYSDQKLYRQAPGAAPEPLTEDGCFYADATVDRARHRLVCVQEDHRNDSAEAVNSIVAVGSRVVPLVAGADFYSDPILSPDGSRLAWLQWNHPNMPWDGTELWAADVNDDGDLGALTKVAGGQSESIFQPEWSPDGTLFYISDRTGWWNLYRAEGSREAGDAVLDMDAEFGKPQWTFSQTTYAFIDANRIALTYAQGGRWKLGVLQLDPHHFHPFDLSLQPTDGVRATPRDLFFIGGSATESLGIVRMSLATHEVEVIRSASSDRIDPGLISAAEAITFESNRQPVHAFYYPPHNPEHRAPAAERPPLLVISHGGPTTATLDILNARIQYWTSRGFAVVDVNYGGSTGYGRAYRTRLNGQWGIVDVADCVNAAKHLVAAGKADPNRLMIRGGSAGGYTTLAALTFHHTFHAGASHYGISDIEVLAQDTHKFESRYLESLVGPYPAAKAVYRQRSPVHFTDRLSAALILFQGLEDKVVPPNQAEMMRDAVRDKGLPVAYVPFEGEQHGFRRAENIIRSLEAELYFYGAVFGFAPADPIAPVVIENLR